MAFIKWVPIISLAAAQGLHQHDFPVFKIYHWFKLQSKSKPAVFLGTTFTTAGNTVLLCN